MAALHDTIQDMIDEIKHLKDVNKNFGDTIVKLREKIRELEKANEATKTSL